jgi:hypothetical protein
MGCMRISRGFSLPAHGAIELLAGIAMMIAPAALSFSPAGLLVSVTLGAILTGTAVSLSTQTVGTASVASHGYFDTVFVLATALAALGLATAGQTSAVIFLAAMVVVQALLGFATRYTAVD